jgi:hypothetical protein
LPSWSIAANLYYRWSKGFLEAGRKQLASDTVREATRDEVKGLRSENRDLKEVVAEITLANRVLKKVWRFMARRTKRETHGIREDGDHPPGRSDGPSSANDTTADATSRGFWKARRGTTLTSGPSRAFASNARLPSR